MPKRKLHFFISVVFFLGSLFLGAQDHEGPLRLQRLTGEIKLDGRLDEPVWGKISPFPLVMHTPEFGIPPSEKSEVYITHDEGYLYVGARLFDSHPERIQANTKKRDYSGANSDSFGIIIDSFNDNENGLFFAVTPLGTRTDFAIFNDCAGPSPINESWNTFWDVATSRNDKGWFAEIRIPFSSLKFQELGDMITMGVTVYRWIPWRNEMLTFPPISQKWGGMAFLKPSLARDVVLKNIKNSKPIYVSPYLLGGVGHTYNLNDEETFYIKDSDPIWRAGLDIKYGITSNLTLDVTVNTDFAQVEADDEQINLTRFSLFFPEKRLFFQERASVFEFNFGDFNRIFHSRQIGLNEDEEKQVPIYGGVRMVGRLGSWDMGFMNMQTVAVDGIPTENFGILRLRRQVLNPFSYMGGILTSRIGADGSYNMVYGLDAILRLFEYDYLTLQYAQSFESDMNNRFLSLEPSRFRVYWEKRKHEGFGYIFGASRVGENYRPAIGFEMREKVSKLENRFWHGWLPGKDSGLQLHQAIWDTTVYLKNENGDPETVMLGPSWLFNFKSGSVALFGIKYFYEDVIEEFSLMDRIDVPVGKFSFWEWNNFFMTPTSKPFYFSTMVDLGSFYDGWKGTLTLEPHWGMSSTFELSGTYQLNHIVFPDRDEKLTAHIGRLRIMAMFSTKLSASAFIQYNSADETVGGNLRFRYNPREGNDLYLVYNEGVNTNRFREIPNRPYSSNRTVMLKYTYTFKL